jgi:hypothetical protein
MKQLGLYLQKSTREWSTRAPNIAARGARVFQKSARVVILALV